MPSIGNCEIVEKTCNGETMGVFTWVIQGYQTLCPKIRYRSSIFKVANYYWRLILRPDFNGDKTLTKIEIKKISWWIKSSSRIYYKYTFTNEDENNLFTCGTAKYQVFNWNYSNDYDIEVSTIENGLLKDNSDLTIIFEMFVTEKDLSNEYDSYIKKFDCQDQTVDFGPYFNDPKLSDVTFSVEGTEIPAHKVILASQSSVFSSMFHDKGRTKVSARKSPCTIVRKASSNTIVVNGIQCCYFEKFLRYLYEKHIDDLEEDAKELINIAEKYDVQSLKRICEDSLCKNAKIEDADELFRLAILSNATNLKSKITTLIVEKLQDLTENSFAELSEEKQCLLAGVFAKDIDVSEEEGESCCEYTDEERATGE